MTDVSEIPASQHTNPPLNAAAVVPHATNELPGGYTRGIYVGVSGTLTFIPAGGDGVTSVTLTALAAGVIHPIVTKRVIAIGTAATNIVAFW